MKNLFWIKIAVCVVAAALIGLVVFNAMRSESGDGSSFFSQFVVAGGPIVWFIQIPLSIITVYLLIEQTLLVRRSRLVPNGIVKETLSQIRQSGFRQFPVRTNHKQDLVSVAMRKAIASGANDLGQLEEIAAESLQEQAMSLLRKVEWHNVIGNISPMLGLLGTVIGMIRTFNEMGVANGQSHPSQLAAGISIAWVTTFWGLLVAIPALSAHGIFRNRIEAIVSEAATCTESVVLDLRRHASLQPQLQSPAASAVGAAI